MGFAQGVEKYGGECSVLGEWGRVRESGARRDIEAQAQKNAKHQNGARSGGRY